MSSIGNFFKDGEVDRPPQRLSTKEKLGKGEKSKSWRINSLDYYADLTGNDSYYRLYMRNLYRIAAGYLDDDSYEHISNPRHTNKNRYGVNYKTPINNYDISTPIISAFLGDKIDRMIKPTVVAINSDIENIKQEEKTRIINQQLQQVFLNEMSKLRDTGFPEQDVLSIQEIDQIVDNIKDEKSITGAKALEYIMVNNEVFRKFRKMFFHWIVTNYTCSVKNVNNNDIEYESVSPLNINYKLSEDQDFIEDGESASVTFFMTNSEVIDKYYDELEEKDIKLLEGRYQNDSSRQRTPFYSDTDVLYSSLVNEGVLNGRATMYSDNNDNNTVTYVNWKSLVKIGRIITENPLTGEEETIEVNEDYKPLEGEKVDWKWVNQVWEGYKVNEGIYFGIRPVPFQRSKFDNPSSCKLLINGRSFMNAHYRHRSIVERLQPYQKRYNVVSYHLEKLINKNKDKIVVMPYGLIPDNENLNISDMMYYADKDSFLFVDSSDPKMLANLQNVRVLDMSLNQNMSFLSDMLRIIKLQAEESVGFNRQRLGNVNSSDGKGTNEDAIQRSNIITSEIFEEFEEFEEREWQGLLDLSKFAWKDGKKETYLNSQKASTLLEVGLEYRELEFGVRATRSSIELRRLEKLRSQSQQQALTQNGVAMSTIIDMENVDSLSEMQEIIKKAEAKFLEQSQASQEAETNAETQKVQSEIEQQDKELAFKRYKVDADNNSDERVALINANASLAGTTSSNVSESQTTPSVELSSSRRNDEFQKNQLAREKNDIEREKIQVNRESNKVALENPVVGET